MQVNYYLGDEMAKVFSKPTNNYTHPKVGDKIVINDLAVIVTNVENAMDYKNFVEEIDIFIDRL